MFAMEKRTCTCYSNSLLMEEVTDISPAKAKSTNISKSTHTVPLKLIHFWKVLKNEDLLQYKCTSGEFKASEQLPFCGEEVITRSSCHTASLLPRSQKRTGRRICWMAEVFFLDYFQVTWNSITVLQIHEKEQQGTFKMCFVLDS